MNIDEFEEGDEVEFTWGGNVTQGIYRGRECRGKDDTLCAMIDTGRDVLPVHLDMVRGVL